MCAETSRRPIVIATQHCSADKRVQNVQKETEMENKSYSVGMDVCIVHATTLQQRPK